MSGFKGKTLRPASLRQGSKSQAATVGLGVAVSLSAMMMMPAHGLAQEAELATVKVQDTAIDANPNAEPTTPSPTWPSRASSPPNTMSATAPTASTRPAPPPSSSPAPCAAPSTRKPRRWNRA